MTDRPIAHAADGRPIYDNTPTVVAVVAECQPRRFLVVRRNNEPGRGLLGLPGGYHMRGENWQSAGCREVREETGYRFAPEGMHLISIETDEYGNNLILAHNSSCLTPENETPPSDPIEVQEVLLVKDAGPARDWAFPRHYAALLSIINQQRQSTKPSPTE